VGEFALSGPLVDSNRERLVLVPPKLDPAAGSQVTYTIPGGQRWRLLALTATLATDATVADRQPALSVTVFGELVVRIPHGRVSPASQSDRYSWCRGVGAALFAATGIRSCAPMPDFELPAGSVVATDVGNFQPADDWGPGPLLVEAVTERGDTAELAAELANLSRELAKFASLLPGVVP
jgi:hypothetical protein